jgi:hypothetical protein
MRFSTQSCLFAYPRWRNERQASKIACGNRYRGSSHDVGGCSTFENGGKKVNSEKDKRQSDLNAVEATVEYAIRTVRLQRQT